MNLESRVTRTRLPDSLLVDYSAWCQFRQRTAQEICARLGECDLAVQQSSFEHARHADERSDANTPRMLRAGQRFEYRRAFSATMHAALGSRYSDLFRWLGLEDDQSSAIVPRQSGRAAHMRSDI